MKQKLFLTSCIAMGFVAPAFAETFPSDGYMAENTTYDDAATFENTGVYSGTVNATAEYTDIFYNIVAGNYLAAGSDDENGTICPAGSYCSGLTHAPYNATENQGIASCPTGYASSAAGASSANECYRTCSGNVTIEHATGVTGNDYYGSGVDTCEPTGCVNGWHLKSGVNGSAIATAIVNIEGVNSAHIAGDGSFGEMNYDGQGAKGKEYYSLTDNNTWAVDYGDKGFLYGQVRCSTVQGVRDFDWDTETLRQPITTHTTSELGSEGGQYCYCNVTGYTPDGGTLQSLSSSWVFSNDYGVAANCRHGCAERCASNMRGTDSPDDLTYRAAMFNSVQSTPAMCEANTITINWSNADAEDISANNAGTATYGEDVRTPVKAETIKGKTFKGWKFSKPEQTPLP